MTDDFIVNLSSPSATPLSTTHTHATLFSGIQVESHMANYKLLDLVTTVTCGSLPIIQARTPLSLDQDANFRSYDVAPVVLAFGNSVECKIPIKDDAVVDLTLSLFHKQPLYIQNIFHNLKNNNDVIII